MTRRTGTSNVRSSRGSRVGSWGVGSVNSTIGSGAAAGSLSHVGRDHDSDRASERLLLGDDPS